MELNSKMYYPVNSRGSGGTQIFLFKMYENESIIFYSGYETIDELSEGGKTVVHVHIKTEEKSEKIIINFSKDHQKIPKKLARNLNNCSQLYDEIETGKYQKSVSDFIKLLDFYDENCIIN
ncbi:hypothetical protein [Mangrovivirga cuniculi]|uniref:Uncharacterized protein n=1 Tax=Mangrovivirga cuniculi TaxID=2715131 RepID=A0A4D7JJL7_9BACT|nr:hypothetical protein [Mangrovivirga cuniculi]QCK16159.1 hypothetical protein DCC35_16125 [Mangrovivirga cuniculi]